MANWGRCGARDEDGCQQKVEVQPDGPVRRDHSHPVRIEGVVLVDDLESVPGRAVEGLEQNVEVRSEATRVGDFAWKSADDVGHGGRVTLVRVDPWSSILVLCVSFCSSV